MKLSIDKKIEWLKNWCEKEGLTLELKGECGFGRPCVGVMNLDTYPDYIWYNDEYERVDSNGDVWTPSKAYHKHPCVAVLGQDEDSISQLYDWCKYFDDNLFHYESKKVEVTDEIELILGRDVQHRMIKTNYKIINEK